MFMVSSSVVDAPTSGPATVVVLALLVLVVTKNKVRKTPFI